MLALGQGDKCPLLSRRLTAVENPPQDAVEAAASLRRDLGVVGL